MTNKVSAEKETSIELSNGKTHGDVDMGDDVITSGDVSGNDKDKKKEDKNIPTVPYYKLFRYAGCGDWLLMLLGTIAAAANGAGLPVLFIFFGDLTTAFTNYGRYAQCSFDYAQCTAAGLTTLDETSFNAEVVTQRESFRSTSVQVVLYMTYLGCGVLAVSALQVWTWALAAVRQLKQIRYQYFRAILRQDIGFHDQTSSGELNVRLSSDLNKVKEGMGEKMAMLIQYLSMSISGLIIGLVYTWKLGLVTLSVAPLIAASSAAFLMVTTSFTKKELDAYATAGSVAEESISSIRTVTAFGGQRNVMERYNSNLYDAKTVGIRKGVANGASTGFLYLTMYGTYALAFWYGTTLVLNGEITVGAMMTTFFSIVIAAYGLGTAGSYFGNITEAKAAAANIYITIDRVPAIDIMSDSGESPDYDKDVAIELTDIDFTYPSRLEYQVLKKVSLKVKQGQQVALVGQSGCGKSTIVQLIQRFYDVQSGAVIVGGRDVRELNVRRLRETIGVVAQEPVLFNTTVRDNICWGNDDVTDDEIYAAAREANAYDFIMKLPQQFDTTVGEGGGKMSGGQKQRIAIARAILRKPKILLLDEATSALDTESESIVQSALDHASAGRTTIVIAHRLSTVRNADKIIAFDGGQVVEQGTHDELVRLNGVYANLARAQEGPQAANGRKKSLDASNGVAGVKRDESTSPSQTMSAAEDPSAPDASEASSNIQKVNTERKTADTSDVSLKPEVAVISNGADLAKKVDGNSEKGKKKGDNENAVEEDEEEDLPKVSAKRLFMMNKPEWGYMAVGSLFAAIAGCADPVSAILFAEVLNIFTLSDRNQQDANAILYGLLFLVVGAAAFIGYTVEAALFSKAGMELTVRMRKRAFSSILRQDIAYFDEPRHNTGVLCARLATDASLVQGATGGKVGVFFKNVSTLGVALGIALAYSWKLTLLMVAFLPFIILGGMIEIQLLTADESKDKAEYEEGSNIAGEAIHNIRTIASFTQEQPTLRSFVKALEGPVRKGIRKSAIMGLAYGYSQCTFFFCYAAVFRLGVELVITQEIGFDDVFKVQTAVLFGAMAIAQNSSFAPDFAAAQVAASRMVALFDRVPDIDSESHEGHKPTHCKGQIDISSVVFRYPTRTDMTVLKGCTISVQPGKTLALVGQSGCGKSTSVQLIERFYDPEEGKILLDGTDIRSLNISWLRQQMGLVSQEPLLFDLSIKENIRFGDCTRTVTEAEVQAAAKSANAHNFISSLPEGYDTRVGASGSQLSGGQKQRVAIARALIRNPKLLLLDEATSALDNESEKIVQAALDDAQMGRTCIVIAHRLSTVKNADLIVVIGNGEVVESGTHDELTARQGAYFSLVNAQLSAEEQKMHSS